MSLVDYLNIRSPLLWVMTDEPRRVINDVTLNVSNRAVYRLDLMDGFVQWEPESKRWLKVVVEIAPGEEGSTNDLQLALLHCYQERGVMLLDHAHQTVEMLMAFLSYVARTYVDAFMEDNLDRIPATYVLMSCKDEVPPELVRDTVKITYGLPTEDEVRTLIVNADKRTANQLNGIDITPYVRAGLGMSEMELAQTCKLSVSQFGNLNPEFINQTKMDKLKSDGILEIRIPKLKLEDIGGLDQIKTLMQRVAWTWNNPEESKRHGLEPLRRILLVGVSGTGKSAICEAAASALGLELAKFGTTQMMDKFVGESEKNMRRAFAQVKAMKPLVLWIDEFGRDMSGGQSSGSVDGGTTDRVHGEFLQGLQELPDEVFLVCAANNISNLAPELTRADRFDKIMFVGFPTLEERVEIFRIHLGAEHTKFDLNALASVTATFTGAEIKALLKEVRFNVVGDHHRAPNTKDIIAFAPRMKGRVWINHQESIREMYAKAKTEWAWASSAQEKEADLIISLSPHNQFQPQDRSKIDSMFGSAVKK